MIELTINNKQALYLSFLLILIIYLGCISNQDKKINKGANLFKIYCQSCHAKASPEHLPKAIWEHTILPRMGTRLGIYHDSLPRIELIESNLGGKLVEAARIYPRSPVLSANEWEILKNYIIDLAPDSLELKDDNYYVSSDSLPLKIRIPKYTYSPPSTTLVKIDDAQNIYIGDANTGSLGIFNTGNLIAQAAVGESPVDIVNTPNSTIVLTIGSFSPTDAPNGKLLYLPKSPNGKTQNLIDKLHRPVDMDFGDIDQDGDNDIVVAEFGKWLGKLSIHIYENGTLRKSIIDNTTGCAKSIFIDLNDDKLLDIVALFGQGDERISAYINKGNQLFERKDLVTFHPSMGSSSLYLFDWNQDGKKDIIYTAGDNADYSPILKPYHGIYIYENTGDLKFEQSVFIPMHGAYKAIPFDFDLDGDLDIAAISFFPDFDNENSGFAIFLNNGSNEFTRHSILSHTYGRWITMDVGDIDDDGDEDIVLGCLSMEIPNDPYSYLKQWINNGYGYLTLENQVELE